MIVQRRRSGSQDTGTPIRWRPPLEDLQVVDRDAAGIEAECQEADHVAKVVQRRRITDLSTEDEAVVLSLDRSRELRVRGGELVPYIPIAKTRHHVGMNLWAIRHDLDPVRNLGASVLAAGQTLREVDPAVDHVEQERILPARHVVPPRPILEGGFYQCPVNPITHRILPSTPCIGRIMAPTCP